MGPDTGPPAGCWTVALPGYLFSIMCFPCGPVAVGLILQVIDGEVQAVLRLFQMSHGHIRVWKGKAKTQIPADNITCEVYRPSRSMRVLSVFIVTKKTRIKVV